MNRNSESDLSMHDNVFIYIKHKLAIFFALAHDWNTGLSRQIYLKPLVLQDERVRKYCYRSANHLLVLHVYRSNVSVDSTPTSGMKFNTTIYS